MPQILTVDAGGDANRSYVVLNSADRTAWCIDPSYGSEKVLNACRTAECRLEDIFLTHTHGDHVASLPDLVEGTEQRPRVWVHHAEARRVPGAIPIVAEGPLPGLQGIEALFTPGHTPGGICYRVGTTLFTGDVLFVDWIGRTDLPGGDSRSMFDSLGRLRTLPNDLIIRPGHHYGSEESRSLGEEIARNRFLACTDYQRFVSLLPELTA